ncbi:hypothetical protein [Rhizobium sp. RAF56]|uniref:hypothetical protein n=1 Tax=Rhizobium sp. RAF56 TaxID=3233062 RepID=UPI003F95C0DB
MSFAAEMKDFAEGFKSGSKIGSDRADNKLKAAETDYYRARTGRLLPATPGQYSAIPDPFSGGGSGATSNASGNADVDDHQVYSSFMDTVKNGYGDPNHRVEGVSNPYALAAIAATGKHESGFSPHNANREWNDGKNNAGGIMS